MRYRMVVPLKRTRHPPEYVARSVAVGLFWAMTPSVGIQMACVLFHWLAVRRIPRWDFNVVHAMAWTWVTNMFTLLPIYYMFYVTGQVLLGRFDDLTGYRGFLKLWDTSFAAADGAASGFVDSAATFWVYVDVIFAGWGLAMLVGCIPYAVVSAWLGYRWSLNLIVHHRAARFARHHPPPHGGSGEA